MNLSRASGTSVLIVDSDRGTREALRMVLEPHHRVLMSDNASEALEILNQTEVDLITLDLRLSETSGADLMRRLHCDYPQVEVIVISGYASIEAVREALRCGAADFLEKPFDASQVATSVARTLARQKRRRRLVGFLGALGDAVGAERHVSVILDDLEESPSLRSHVRALLGRAGRELEQKPHGTPQDLPRSLDLLEFLAATLEAREPLARGHARRVALYAEFLAERTGLGPEERAHARIAGLLHDVGKVRLPLELLTRPKALSPDEHHAVARHSELAGELLEPLGLPEPVLLGIRHHHERWDGGGTPTALVGEEIPLLARIVCVADAVDAMTREQPHRRPLAWSAVTQELASGSGKQFDPALAMEFISIVDSDRSFSKGERTQRAKSEWTEPKSVAVPSAGPRGAWA